MESNNTSINGNDDAGERTRVIRFDEEDANESTFLIDDTASSRGVNHADRRRTTFGRSMKQSLTGGFEDFESSSGALKYCFIAIIIYLSIAVIAFSFVFERWTIIDSLYFGVVTFTTVGYGDLYPTTPGGRIFCTFFVLFGILILGVALGIIGERVVEAQEAAIEGQKADAKLRVHDLFKKDGEQTPEEESLSMRNYTLPSRATVRDEFMSLVKKDGPLVLVIILVSLLFGWAEGWNVEHSIYYCFITTTTVGYGDMHPTTQLTRFIAIFYIPATVSILAAVLGRIAEFYMEMKAHEAEKNFLDRELTLTDISIMDTDDDGSVDLVEFLTFMLDAMQKVSKEEIEELKQLFKKLDADGSGALQKEDLLIMRQRRMAAALSFSEDELGA